MNLRYPLFVVFALTAVPGSLPSIAARPEPAVPDQEQAQSLRPVAEEHGSKANISFAKDVRPFLSRHCYACHGNGKNRGEVSLDKFRDDQDAQKDRKLWESVLHM